MGDAKGPLYVVRTCPVCGSWWRAFSEEERARVVCKRCMPAYRAGVEAGTKAQRERDADSVGSGGPTSRMVSDGIRDAPLVTVEDLEGTMSDDVKPLSAKEEKSLRKHAAGIETWWARWTERVFATLDAERERAERAEANADRFEEMCAEENPWLMCADTHEVAKLHIGIREENAALRAEMERVRDAIETHRRNVTKDDLAVDFPCRNNQLLWAILDDNGGSDG